MSLQIETPIWSGPFDHAAVERLTESPVRGEWIRRLADGQTAVWLVLASGDRQKDDAAAAHLNEELQALQQSLQLRDLIDSFEDLLFTASPRRIEFSLLRVPCDAAEQALIGMLLQTEPDPPECTDPMAFPVVGWGRPMFGLMEEGITVANIRDSAGLLVPWRLNRTGG